MNIWLDDIRIPPQDWHWFTSVDDCIDALLTEDVEAISLDNDLGYLDEYEMILAPEGYRVAEWMEKNQVWPYMVSVHSSNTVAVTLMQDIIRGSNEYKKELWVHIGKYPAYLFMKA